jgi:hypothetical protein
VSETTPWTWNKDLELSSLLSPLAVVEATRFFFYDQLLMKLRCHAQPSALVHCCSICVWVWAVGRDNGSSQDSAIAASIHLCPWVSAAEPTADLQWTWSVDRKWTKPLKFRGWVVKLTTA